MSEATGPAKSGSARKPLLVTAAILSRDMPSSKQIEILIARRKLTASSEAGKWEFPGGKMEFGETPEQSLKREIGEELGLEIEVGELLKVVSHVYHPGQENSFHVVLLCYICRLAEKSREGQFELHDVADARWLDTAQIHGLVDGKTRVNALTLSDFAAADHPALEALSDYLRKLK